MLKTLIITLLFSASVFAADITPRGNEWYTGFDSSEALVEFNHWVEIESTKAPGPRRAENQVESQLAHLFGPLSARKFPAVPKVDHEFNITDIVKVTNRLYRIHYSYQGHFVIRFGIDSKMNLVLPNNPDTIYAAGLRGGTNPCTDEHYQGEGDFWYFWNPANANCSLIKGQDYSVVVAKVLRLPNEKTSYPEYNRLANSEGVIDVSLFFGMDSPTRKPNPVSSDDVNASNFVRTAEALKNLGFESIAQKRGQIFYAEIFEKNYAGPQGVRKMRIKVYFGPTGINEESNGFHQLLKSALEKDAVVVYDGHSGLGGHLDLASIEESLGATINMPLDRYQILFFNSCSSYPYYNTQYFERKKTDEDPRGSRNLDILTNGLSTYFNTIANSNFVLLKALDTYAQKGQRTSYQKLAKDIDSENLFGVNGDEDNP